MGIFSSSPSIAESVHTDINSLGDQGNFVSQDESMAMQHRSTVPDSYYKWKYQIEGGMNMDRGGFGTITKNGVPTSIYACAFDGVSHGGKINAYAAQAFAQNCISELQRASMHGFGQDIRLYWQALYNELQNGDRNPGNLNPNFEACGGSATAVTVNLTRSATTGWVIEGSALGDAAAILVKADGKIAMQLNAVNRIEQNAQDTGGQLEMCNFQQITQRELSLFTTKLDSGDILLLATDGLTDNMSMDVLPFVISLPFFDEAVTMVCPWTNMCNFCRVSLFTVCPTPSEITEKTRITVGDYSSQNLCHCYGFPPAEEVNVEKTQAVATDNNEKRNEKKTRFATNHTTAKPRPHLPSLAEITAYFPDAKREAVSTVSPLKAVTRLNNYVHWVTHTVASHQDVMFKQGLQGELKMREIKERLARKEITTQQAQEEAKKMYEDIVANNKRMTKWYAGKTDDLLIIALRPDWATANSGGGKPGGTRSRGSPLACCSPPS